MKNILSAIGAILLLSACSGNSNNASKVKTLQNRCTEYEVQVEQLRLENKKLQAERDSLNAVVENVRSWLYNN